MSTETKIDTSSDEYRLLVAKRFRELADQLERESRLLLAGRGLHWCETELDEIGFQLEAAHQEYLALTTDGVEVLGKTCHETGQACRWDGFSKRCCRDGKRCEWKRGENHTFLTPEVYAGIY